MLRRMQILAILFTANSGRSGLIKYMKEAVRNKQDAAITLKRFCLLRLITTFLDREPKP